MSGRGFVILTDPARCDLAGGDVLVQAILQVQQLNQAGLAASQAFCDHPAAATKFLEAYTNAYPELQQRSFDLPPPEVLRSIVAEGRAVPLQAPAASESAKLGEPSQLYPLYVLSLGAPDALMRVLQENRLAASDIQVVEIAALEDTDTEAMTVAEAVAHDPITRLSWRSETSAETGRDDDGDFPSSEIRSGDPVTLATVEVDLDTIQLDRTGEQKNRSMPDAVPGETAVASPTPVGPTTGDSANSGVTSGNVRDVGAPDQAISADRLGTPAPAIETSATSPSLEVVAGTRAASAEISQDTITAAAAPDTVTAPDDDEQSEPGSGHDVESPPVASGEAAPDDKPRVADDAPDTPDDPGDDDRADDGDLGSVEPPPAAHDQAAPIRAADAEQTASAQDPDDTDGQSFSGPGQDVLYSTSSSFVVDADDVTYPLPPGPVPEGDLLKALYGGAEDCEVVDLEGTLDALFGDVTVPEDSDVDLIRSPAAGFCASNDGSEPGAPVLPSVEGGGADEDNVQDEWAPVTHDLDI